MRSYSLAAALALLAACPPPRSTVPPPIAPAPPPPPITTPPPPPPEPVVVAPAQPVLRLPRNFTPTAAQVRLAIDPKLATFDGAITLTGTIAERSQIIWLHGRGLDIKHATATLGSTTATLAVTPHADDLLELRADPPLDPGTWQLALDYSGKLDALNTAGVFKETVAGTPYVYTQFEAIYARRAFPCIDEPDLKIPWQVTLDVPTTDTAVANAPEQRTEPLDATHKRVVFAPTKPLPSYLVAFGVGPFDIVAAGTTKSGTPIRVITPKGRGGDAAYAAKTTPKVLDLLEDWFGMPYPFDKLDLLTIPSTVGFGAMENAGLVTFNEQNMLFDPNHASMRRKHGWVLISSHELSHQWFGDYVTTAWWDDIWLNEGFADWLETKIASRFDPTWHDELLAGDMRNRALDADALTTARKIREPIESTSDILNAFDAITYQKGASVLHTFEAYVGEAAFQRGVHDYIKARAYGNATSADFIAAISAAANKDLAPAFSSLLDQNGVPELEATLECGGRGGVRVQLAQHRYTPPGAALPPTGKPYIVPVCVAYERAGKRAETCTLLEQLNADLPLDTQSCPRWLWPNAGGRGYYHVNVTTSQLVSLRDEAWPLLTWPERRALFGDVAQSARFHPHGRRDVHLKLPQLRVPLALALSLVPKMLTGGDRFTITDAVALPLGLDSLVADDLRTKYQGWLRALFGPGATSLGTLPKADEDLDAEDIRTELYTAVAWTGRDPDLAKQAVELSANWRELPPAVRLAVTQVAVDASPEVFARVLADVKRESDRVRRADLLAALAFARDPKEHDAALQLMLDPSLDPKDTFYLLFGPTTQAVRAASEAFYRTHEKELLARLPKDAVSGGVEALAELFTGACDPKRRDEIADYVTHHFGGMPGGERAAKQAIEEMDQCVASRTSLEPQVRAWLGGWKPPIANSRVQAPAPTKPKAHPHHPARSK